MLVSGIWHGAGLNFIVWGLLHGIMLSVRRLWRNFRGNPADAGALVARLFSWFLTFLCVNFAWAFFCMDLHTAIFFFRRLILG
jgi:alginate O-acetyltransferase complex protein AlgI